MRNANRAKRLLLGFINKFKRPIPVLQKLSARFVGNADFHVVKLSGKEIVDLFSDIENIADSKKWNR